MSARASTRRGLALRSGRAAGVLTRRWGARPAGRTAPRTWRRTQSRKRQGTGGPSGQSRSAAQWVGRWCGRVRSAVASPSCGARRPPRPRTRVPRGGVSLPQQHLVAGLLAADVDEAGAGGQVAGLDGGGGQALQHDLEGLLNKVLAGGVLWWGAERVWEEGGGVRAGLSSEAQGGNARREWCAGGRYRPSGAAQPSHNPSPLPQIDCHLVHGAIAAPLRICWGRGRGGRVGRGGAAAMGFGGGGGCVALPKPSRPPPPQSRLNLPHHHFVITVPTTPAHTRLPMVGRRATAIAGDGHADKRQQEHGTERHDGGG